MVGSSKLWHEMTVLQRQKNWQHLWFADCCSPWNRHYLAEGTTRVASSAWQGESIQWPDWSHFQRSRWILTSELPEPSRDLWRRFHESRWLKTHKKGGRASYQSQSILFSLHLTCTSRLCFFCGAAKIKIKGKLLARPFIVPVWKSIYSFFHI